MIGVESSEGTLVQPMTTNKTNSSHVKISDRLLSGIKASFSRPPLGSLRAVFAEASVRHGRRVFAERGGDIEKMARYVSLNGNTF